MRDETDLNGLKLTIDLKRGVDPDKLMAKLSLEEVELVPLLPQGEVHPPPDALGAPGAPLLQQLPDPQDLGGPAYTTTLEAILDKVAELIKAGKLKEINDMRDETDLNGMLRSLISATYSAWIWSMPKPIIRLGTTSASFSVSPPR